VGLALIMIGFANILLDKQLITRETITAPMFMAVASTMLTIPMVSPKLQLTKGKSQRVEMRGGERLNQR
jgi:hypothetical protein